MTYDYLTAYNHWGIEERQAVDRVIASGRFTMGEEVEAFEHEFAAYHGRKHCIMVNSGSSANLLAVAALDIKGDKAARVPALAWATTYAPIMQAGIRLDLMDCDDSWNAYLPGAVVVPILGNPLQNIMGQRFIEDCCESVGARDNLGILCGNRSKIATYSFFYSHQLSAIEGGAIITNSNEIARMCRLLRNHGWTKGEGNTFQDEYKFIVAGYNLRSLELHAAIARAQLSKLDSMAAERRKNWKFFANLAQNLNIKLQEITSPDGFNPFCIAFTVSTEAIRETLAKAFRAEGIDCRPAIGGSFRLQPYGNNYDGPPTPNADRIHRTGMMLGVAPFPIPDKIERAVKVLRKHL